MTDQNTPDGNATTPPAGTPDGFPWSAPPPPPAEPGFTESYSDSYSDIGHTQMLPPYQQPPSATALAPARRGLAAGVLVGALFLGGAAGVGGAAWYDAWQGDEPVGTTVTTPGSVEATKTSVVPDGSIEKVAATVLPSVVKINVTGRGGTGSGSGIVLSADGNILTNNHVVSNAGDSGGITVTFNDGKTVKARILGTDPVTDMAVIKAEGVDDLTPAAIGVSSDLKVGQAVVAVGSPYGLNSTVTTGIVSALNRPVSVSTSEGNTPFGQQTASRTTYPAIQTDAAINPGNSGGALVDLSGRVIGINSSIRTSGGSVTGSGGSIGLGFAIPIDEVRPIVNQIINGEEPTHARLAITVSDVAPDASVQGAQVGDVEAGGPADDAGLEKGDVITKVDDDLIDGSESLIATIRGHRPGEEVTLTYVRDGRTATAKATLGSDADSEQS